MLPLLLLLGLANCFDELDLAGEAEVEDFDLFMGNKLAEFMLELLAAQKLGVKLAVCLITEHLLDWVVIVGLELGAPAAEAGGSFVLS